METQGILQDKMNLRANLVNRKACKGTSGQRSTKANNLFRLERQCDTGSLLEFCFRWMGVGVLVSSMLVIISIVTIESYADWSCSGEYFSSN
mmetsp:Transcript_6928/g.14056  ORF Transcript_6928/g.14056 Transcript_6928/m.14056 type:complete len:92 (+) Transcript_6928:1453-1728(+)